MEDKKEIIRQAAIKVISREGFYNTKAASIAEEAGVAVGTIYNYFDNKEAILEYIFSVEFEKRMSFLQGVMNKDLSVFDKILLFLKRHFEEVKDNPELGRILVREKEFTRKKNQAAIGEYLNSIPTLIEDMLNQAEERGEVQRINARIISVVIFGAIQGVVEKAVSKKEFDLLDLAAGEIVQLLKQGI